LALDFALPLDPEMVAAIPGMARPPDLLPRPEPAGDRLFANTYLAYESLPPGLRTILDRLVAINTSATANVTRTREGRMHDAARAEARKEYVAEYPVLRTYPGTGRRALYVNGGHKLRFRDMTEAESAPLLLFLFAHLARPEFTCRFRWEPGSLAFWENRCAQHNPIND
jgi:taurine dioxygenase